MFPIGNMRDIVGKIRQFKENNQTMGYKEEFGSHNEVSEGPFKRPMPFIDQKPVVDNSGVIKNIQNMTRQQMSKPQIPGGGNYQNSDEQMI